jgi:hypothetical protein
MPIADRWRITQAELSDRDALNLVAPKLIGQDVVALPAPFLERSDHEACRLNSTIRVLLERGQHPVTEELQAILRRGRTRHLNDGRAVLPLLRRRQRRCTPIASHGPTLNLATFLAVSVHWVKSKRVSTTPSQKMIQSGSTGSTGKK